MAENKAPSENIQDAIDAATQKVDEAQQQAADEQVKLLPEEASVEELRAELDAALAQAEANKEAELRAYAEMQNIRRRAERDVENAHKFALEKMTSELLTVVDNLERALQATDAADETTKALRDGVELTLSGFITALGKFNIDQIDPEGEPFDPQLHQAMSVIENANVEPDTVVAVMQKGYSLNGRLVRPAMVMVSKAAGVPTIDEKA